MPLRKSTWNFLNWWDDLTVNLCGMVQLFQKQYFSVNTCAIFMENFLRFDRSFTVLLETVVKVKPYSKMSLRWKKSKRETLPFVLENIFTVISFRGNYFSSRQYFNFFIYLCSPSTFFALCWLWWWHTQF